MRCCVFLEYVLSESAVRDTCCALTRDRTPLQLPSRYAQCFRDNMSSALGAASALLVLGRCSVPARLLQHHALLGAMLSQRSLARVSLQDKRFLGSERLQLLCCGSPLSILLLRLVAVVDRSGRSSAEHRYIVCTVKRYFSGVAHRLWPTPRSRTGFWHLRDRAQVFGTSRR